MCNRLARIHHQPIISLVIVYESLESYRCPDAARYRRMLGAAILPLEGLFMTLSLEVRREILPVVERWL